MLSDKHLRTIVMSLMLMAATLSATAAGNTKNGDFTVGKGAFLLNGEPFVVKAAEIHYPRIPRPYWEHRIRMCKALGMNTVCIYIFWNFHEQREGEFDFTGDKDVAEFCRLAQRNGMYVIVRPGPYVCAEWEMGGLPWWLLKKKDIRLRERDPYFMERVRLFERKVGEQLAPLTIQNGGPIIMVQVENEYGSYGEDKEYVSEIRDIVRSSGFDKVTLFQCDWASNFTKNGLDDLTWTMNFGTGANIDAQFKRLGELRPDAPKMCSEYWSGWFDKWGARHETRPAAKMTAGIDEMLSKGISFSLYMTHGGTSFGHWAGANSPGFAPDVTSYDYDAPINEQGAATPKYHELRQTMAKYSAGQLPAVPKPAARIITIPKFALTEFAPLRLGIDSTATTRNTVTMEDMNIGWGAMVYETTLPGIATPSLLTIDEAHDYAQIFVDGSLMGTIDRVRKERTLRMPPVKRGSRLTILVEAMGRINFGRAIKDFKGITGSVTITAEEDAHVVTYDLRNWSVSRIADDYATAVRALDVAMKSPETAKTGDRRGYYRGFFTLKKTGDTFLNMETWGKGQVYVNGHPLGRYWSIGPQQTLYLPGCWLKKGRNEVIVLDVTTPKETVCHGQAVPELNKLNVKKTGTDKAAPMLSAMKPAVNGAFAAGNGWQKKTFNQVSGRYIAIECIDAHDGGATAAIAELYVLDRKGRRLSREPWAAGYCDSEDAAGGNHTVDKVFDLQESTYWSTKPGDKYPHTLVIDLGSPQDITGIEYLPRAEEGAPGSVKNFRVYVY